MNVCVKFFLSFIRLAVPLDDFANEKCRDVDKVNFERPCTVKEFIVNYNYSTKIQFIH